MNTCQLSEVYRDVLHPIIYPIRTECCREVLAAPDAAVRVGGDDGEVDEDGEGVDGVGGRGIGDR